MSTQRILVATDLSEGSLAMCRFAASVADRFGAAVTYLHVAEAAPPELPAPEELRAYLHLADSEREARLTRLRESLRGPGGATADVVIVRGAPPKRAIVEEASARGADAIVVARRSRASLGDRLLGSTTSQVLRMASVPVLVVPEGVDALEDELGATLGPVIAATDLHDTSLRAVAAGRGLASGLSAPLLVVHVLDWPSAADLMVSAPNDLMTRVARRMKLRAIDELRAEVGPMGVPEDAQRVINGPSPAEALADLAERESACLVAVASTGKGALKRIFLGSTSERLVKLATRPVLVMPSAWLAPDGG